MFSALRDYIDPAIAAISTLMSILSTGLMLGLRLIGDKGAKGDEPLAQVALLAGGCWAVPHGHVLPIG